MIKDNITEQEKVIRILKGQQFIRNSHGSLYNRGSADSYYGRGPSPHWHNNGVRVANLTAEERAEYMAGYNDNEASGAKKDWS